MKFIYSLGLFAFLIFLAGCSTIITTPIDSSEKSSVSLSEINENEIRIASDGTKYLINPNKISC